MNTVEMIDSCAANNLTIMFCSGWIYDRRIVEKSVTIINDNIKSELDNWHDRSVNSPTLKEAYFSAITKGWIK